MIPAFLEEKLEDRNLRRFLAHYQTCANCREELEIQYLVGKVFDQAEVGEEINLSRDIPAFLDRQRRQMDFRTRLGRYAFVVEGITVIAAAATALIYLR